MENHGTSKKSEDRSPIQNNNSLEIEIPKTYFKTEVQKHYPVSTPVGQQNK